MPERRMRIELVPVTVGEPATVHVFVTIDGERARVRVPRVLAGTAHDESGRATEHAVRAELFDRGARGLVVVVTHACREQGSRGPRTLDRSVWASTDGRSWAPTDGHEPSEMPSETPIAWAQAGNASWR